MLFVQTYQASQTTAQVYFNFTSSNHLYLGNYQPSGNTWIDLTSNSTLSTNTWYHVAATWSTIGSNITMNIYINGCLDASSSVTGTWNTTTAYPVIIGGWDAGTTNHPTTPYSFNGQIDEARIWNIAQSQNNIIANMAQTISSPPSSLKVYYPFDNNTNDASGNSYNGTAVNSPGYSSSNVAHINSQCSSGCRLAAVTTGIKQLTSSNQIVFYPNPNSGNFVIETSEGAKQNMQVYDINGKIVLSQIISGKTNVDATSLNEGVYNIIISGNEGVTNKRLVIAR
jgi:hypothetical protein